MNRIEEILGVLHGDFVEVTTKDNAILYGFLKINASINWEVDGVEFDTDDINFIVVSARIINPEIHLV
jgi:hypothetical protein